MRLLISIRWICKMRLQIQVIYRIIIFTWQITIFMDIQLEKLHLIEKLTQIEDIDIIEQVKELLNQKNNQVFGYGINGTPITRKQLIKRIEAAEERIDRGEYTTQEDIEKESQNW
jgi:hypothetical protein